MIPIAASEPARSATLTRVAVGVSIAVHLAAVALSLGYAGAGLFQGGEAEAVAVTVVTPQDVAALAAEPKPSPQQKPEPEPKLDLRLPPIQPPKPEQTLRQQPAPKPTAAPAASAAPQQAPTLASPHPAYAAPQPDVSLKYQVDLGLKEMSVAPPSAPSTTSGNADFDAPAMSKADIGADNIAAFRADLKACAALPAPLSPDDRVMIVLRARFTPDGRLAAAPILIEASASSKGPALMQAAIAALQSCQPYAALPADRYAEWRVLDLRFTPQDFRRG